MSENLVGLTEDEVSLAFLHLANREPPPPELEHLTEKEWFSLAVFLKYLLKEREASSVQGGVLLLRPHVERITNYRMYAIRRGATWAMTSRWSFWMSLRK